MGCRPKKRENWKIGLLKLMNLNVAARGELGSMAAFYWKNKGQILIILSKSLGVKYFNRAMNLSVLEALKIYLLLLYDPSIAESDSNKISWLCSRLEVLGKLKYIFYLNERNHCLLLFRWNFGTWSIQQMMWRICWQSKRQIGTIPFMFISWSCFSPFLEDNI